MNRNLIKLWVRDAFTATFLSLTSTSVLTAYFLTVGLAENQIGFYFSAVPVANLVISLLCSGITRKMRNSVKGYTLFTLISIPVILLFCLLCFIKGSGLFPAILMIGVLLSALTAIRTIFEYQLPCDVMELNMYSVYVSVSGIISGVCGILCGLAVSYCYKLFQPIPVAIAVFSLSGLTLLAAALITRNLKLLPTAQASQPQAAGSNSPIAGIRELFRDSDFKHLAAPNLVRGFGEGILKLIPVLAVRELNFTESGLSFITVCTYLGTLVSCCIYAPLARRWGAEKSGLLGGALFCLSVVCFFFGRIPFYVIYTVSYAGYYIASCAIPDALYQRIAPEKISLFHTWRLALLTCGTAIASVVLGSFADALPAFVWLAIGAASIFYCVIAYAIRFKGSSKASV